MPFMVKKQLAEGEGFKFVVFARNQTQASLRGHTGVTSQPASGF
jgi:hypothetical protein